MPRRLLLLVCCTVGCRPASDAPAGASPEATSEATSGAASATPTAVIAPAVVTDSTLGPLRIGMRIPDAARAVPGVQMPPNADPQGCSYLVWPTAPAGVLVMVEDSTVVRLDVTKAGLATTAGAQVGDSIARLDALYAGRLSVGPHKYVPTGRYVTVSPSAGADPRLRLIFETDRGRVTRYRIGRTPAVEYVEGCY